MSTRKVIPPWIFCPRCGERVEIVELKEEEELKELMEQGYTAAGRGVCRCGVVAVLCYQPLPASPTFSLFFDIYTPDVVKRILISEHH